MATNFDDLINLAGNKILGNEALTATTFPKRFTVLSWLNDAQLELTRLLDPTLVQTLVVPPVALNGTAGNANLPADYFKFIAAYDDTNNRPLTFVNQNTWSLVISGSFSYLQSNCTIFGDDLYYVPAATTAANVKLTYIKPPTVMTDAASAMSLADEFISLLTDYALIQSRAPEDELQQYQAYQGAWYQRIRMLNGESLELGAGKALAES